MISFRDELADDIIETNGDLDAQNDQYQIFSSMAEYVSRYLRLPKPRLTKIIGFAAFKWQENRGVSFKHFAQALPQERLVMAESMKNEISSFLTPLLSNSNDKERLDEVLEKALRYYLDNFATR